MKVQLDDTHPDHYIEVEPTLYGLALIASVDEEEYAVLNLTRGQTVELIASIFRCFHDKDYHKEGISLKEIEEELIRQIFNNLPPGEGKLGKLGVLTEDDFMEDHDDNL